MNIFLVLISIILFVNIIFYFIDKNKSRVLRKLKFTLSLPGQSILLSFIIGLQITCGYKGLLKYLLTFTERFGNLSRFIVGTDMYVILTKPEDYKQVLTNINGNYKSSVTISWQAFLGDGIIRVSGIIHKLRRKIIEPLFNSKFLSKYLTYFDKCSSHCADLLEKKMTNGDFDVKPYITRSIMDAILVTTFVGIEGTAQKGDYDDLLHWQKRLFKLTYEKSLKPWLNVEQIFSLTDNAKQTRIGLQILQDFIHYMSRKIKERKTLNKTIDIEQRPESVFLEQLFENTVNSDHVTDQDFLDDIKNLYIAALNTMTELTHFVLLMLAMHLEIQENLRKEISTLENETIDASRISRMQYLHMVIKETLRLFPVAPLMAREVTGDIKLESCTLPDGCYVMIPIYAIHRNPLYWDNVNEFIPERFAPENAQNRNHDTYLPFGMGSRSCPGQKYMSFCVGIMIINLIKRFRFATSANMKDLDILTNDILIRSPDNIKLSLSHV